MLSDMEPLVGDQVTTTVPRSIAMPAVTPPPPSDPLWTMLSVAGVALAVLDGAGFVMWCNPQFADLADRQPTQMLGRSIGDALGTDRAERLRATFTGVARGEGVLQRYEVETSDWAGIRRRLALSASTTVAWDGRPRVAVVAEDLTSERRSSRRGGHADPTPIGGDPLLGLPNRATLEGLLGTSLRRAVRKMSPLAVMVVDIDGLQETDREVGGIGSDEALRVVTRGLLASLREQDVVSRVHTDRFVVVAEEVDDAASAQQLAARLAAVVAASHESDGSELQLSASIGFTLGGGHERPADLLADAQVAAAEAQRLGGGHVVAHGEWATQDQPTLPSI